MRDKIWRLMPDNQADQRHKCDAVLLELTPDNIAIGQVLFPGQYGAVLLELLLDIRFSSQR